MGTPWGYPLSVAEGARRFNPSQGVVHVLYRVLCPNCLSSSTLIYVFENCRVVESIRSVTYEPGAVEYDGVTRIEKPRNPCTLPTIECTYCHSTFYDTYELLYKQDISFSLDGGKIRDED